MIDALLFYTAFATLLAHELDAVHKREWRLLYVLRTLPEETARTAFILLHIPLVALLLWLVFDASASVRAWTVISLDLFMLIHAGLHWRLRAHPAYDFHSALSRGLIYGAAAMAGLHLAVRAL